MYKRLCIPQRMVMLLNSIQYIYNQIFWLNKI